MDVALIHRRLSIIDHAGGAQPMVIGIPQRAATVGERSLPTLDTPTLISREGAPYEPLRAHACPKCGPGVVAVAFNGCIYNHRELRRELEAAGHEFFTDHSDTEVLLHGWREWGFGLCGRLDGMFAVAIVDESRADGVLLARDSFGEKPLYHLPAIERGDSGCVAFGSTSAGLVRLSTIANGCVTPGFDASAITNTGPWVRFGWNQATPYQGVTEQFTGQYTQVARDRTQAANDDDDSDRWFGWWGDVLGPRHDAWEPECVDRVLRAAVHDRLEADVPLGCFLSGGIDSALVCRYAAEMRPDVAAYTVRMPVAGFDESEQAAETARVLGVRHVILDCDPRPATDLIDVIRQIGLPFGDSSLLPSMWVCRAARREVSVALAGDGGDELFMGYDRHRVIKAIARTGLIPQSVWRTLSGLLPPARNPRSVAARAARFLGSAAGSGYKELVALFPYPLDRRIGLSSAWPMHYGMTPVARGVDLSGVVDWSRRFDTMFYLPYDLMRKSDTASMACGLEVRSPFLSREVARLGIHASVESLMPRGQRKGLLRAVARRYLPAEIVDRPKMGFAIPIGEWFRTDYGGMRRLLYDHLESADPFPGLAEAGVEINMNFVRRMLREHDAAGERSINPWHGRDHSQRLYMLLVLSIWCKWLRGLRGGE
ncbi:MAG TPA: asparagine synthase-related protein [Phycisphaerales bacterium]|nr:asparagine synthase-related protein [Phycisphaerales bacterium]